MTLTFFPLMKPISQPYSLRRLKIASRGMVSGLLVLTFLLSACDNRRPRYDVNVQQTVASTAADDLDLRAVGELVTEVRSPEELERALNDPQIGLNNMDLDEDGNVDYIEVEEFGSGNSRGFSLTTEVEPGEVQEIATISIEKDAGNYARVETHGNPNIYGHNHYYHNRIGLGEIVMWSMLMDRTRGPWRSPYGYGDYPAGWNRYDRDPPSRYRNRVNNRAGSGWQQSSQPRTSAVTQSPNKGKTAPSVKAPLANPTQAQKSFQARNPSQRVRSGGFGRSSSPSQPSVRSSPRTGSRSSGGK